MQKDLFLLTMERQELVWDQAGVESQLKATKVQSRVASILEDGEDLHKALGDTLNWVRSFRVVANTTMDQNPSHPVAGASRGPVTDRSRCVAD